MNKAKRTRGIILITVMLFLFILSLLTLASLTLTHQTLQLHNNFGRSTQDLMTAEAGLSITESLLKRGAIPAARIDLHFSPAPWLASQHGTLNYLKQIIYYNVTLLTNEVCVMNRVHASGLTTFNQGTIYRVTVWLVEQADPTVILQSTFASANASPCQNDHRTIRAGRLSWREIM